VPIEIRDRRTGQITVMEGHVEHNGGSVVVREFGGTTHHYSLQEHDVTETPYRLSTSAARSQTNPWEVVVFVLFWCGLLVGGTWVLKHPGQAFSIVAAVVSALFWAALRLLETILGAIGAVLGFIWDAL
jgi:hypothetical protein